MLPTVFQAFLDNRPVCVMARALLERLFRPERLNHLFERTALRQYTNKLPFSSLVELMTCVVSCVDSSVYSAYRKRRKSLGVSDQAIYDKLDNMEVGISAALVADSAKQSAEIIDQLGAKREPLLPGYHVRILDGNHFSATQRRLKPLRPISDAPLPGKALVVLDPQTGLATDVFLTPDGHAQERSLLDDVIPVVRPKDLWIADRNFCTLKLLFSTVEAGAFFVIRQHGNVTGRLLGQKRYRGISPSGKVSEQDIELEFEGRKLRLRRITVYLNEATRDGDSVIHILTNLPDTDASAVVGANLYLNRWKIETFFAEVTRTLACEIDTLAYPKAALFVFCLALMISNAVAVMKSAIRAEHGAEKAEEMSGYYLGLEIEETHEGMMVAIPESEWAIFRMMSLDEFVVVLKEMARRMDLDKYRRSKRGAKKPQPKRTPYRKGGHVSTHQILAQKPP